MPGSADTFSQIAEPQQGPFSQYLSVVPPSPQDQQQQQFTGWEAHPHAILGGELALGFLKGIRTNRVMQAAQEERNNQIALDNYRNQVNQQLQNPDLTDEGRQQILSQANEVMAHHTRYELKDAPKDGVGGFFKNLLTQATGGNIPARKPINFDEETGKLTQLVNSPGFNQKKNFELATQKATAAVNQLKQQNPTPTEQDVNQAIAASGAFKDMAEGAPKYMDAFAANFGVRFGPSYSTAGSGQAIMQQLTPLLQKAGSWRPTETPPASAGGQVGGRLTAPPPQGMFGQPMTPFERYATQPPPGAAPPATTSAPPSSAAPAQAPTPGAANVRPADNAEYDFRGNVAYDPNPYYGPELYNYLSAAAQKPEETGVRMVAAHPIVTVYGEGENQQLGHTMGVTFSGPGVPPGYWDANTGRKIQGSGMAETSSQALDLQNRQMEKRQAFAQAQQARSQAHSDLMQQRALAASAGRQLNSIQAAYVRQAITIADDDMRQGRSLGEARSTAVANLNRSFDDQINTFKRSAVARAQAASMHPLTQAQIDQAEKGVQPDIDQVNKDRENTIGAFTDAVDETAPLTPSRSTAAPPSPANTGTPKPPPKPKPGSEGGAPPPGTIKGGSLLPAGQ